MIKDYQCIIFSQLFCFGIKHHISIEFKRRVNLVKTELYYSLDPSSGTSRDWAYGHNRTQIPYVYTLELRNKSSFVLPPDQIIPTGHETWIGLKAAILAMNLSSPKVET